MRLHANAALSLNRRRLLCSRVVDERWSIRRAAVDAQVSERCARKWVGRYRSEAELGLLDRSSAIHVDVKKLGRIQGGAGKRSRGGTRSHYNSTRTDATGIRRNTVRWACVHIAVDDCTRLAYAEVLENEKASTVVGFLCRAVAFYERHGITVQQLLTVNGPGYRSAIFAVAWRSVRIRMPGGTFGASRHESETDGSPVRNTSSSRPRRHVVFRNDGGAPI